MTVESCLSCPMPCLESVSPQSGRRRTLAPGQVFLPGIGISCCRLCDAPASDATGGRTSPLRQVSPSHCRRSRRARNFYYHWFGGSQSCGIDRFQSAHYVFAENQIIYGGKRGLRYENENAGGWSAFGSATKCPSATAKGVTGMRQCGSVSARRPYADSPRGTPGTKREKISHRRAYSSSACIRISTCSARFAGCRGRRRWHVA